MKCLIEELNDLDILPWGWVMIRRTPNTDPEDGFIELHYTGDTNLIEENAALKRENKRLSKIERVARYYLENGEPELADELESLLKERTMTDKERGLYRKYRVSRLDDVEGKHNECFYFVLDTVHDPFATPALRAYANACREEFPVLAQDIDALLTAEEQE